MCYNSTFPSAISNIANWKYSSRVSFEKFGVWYKQLHTQKGKLGCH